MRVSSIVPAPLIAPSVKLHRMSGIRQTMPRFLTGDASVADKGLSFTELVFSCDTHRVIYSMVHDFRHHLSTAYANSEFLSNRSVDPVEADELLGEIKLAIDCMTEQLDSLLLFAQTGPSLRTRCQPLEPIVEKAIQMVRSRPDTKCVHLTSEIRTRVEGNVDGDRLCSAIFNLVLNACQAASVAAEDQTVVVELCHEGSDIFVRITDTGPGVPQALRPTLFIPFMRYGDKPGTGLGLAIARCVAEEHGGNVYLERSCPGRTTFVLQFPERALEIPRTASPEMNSVPA
jgi:signal transduction histidine kinase